MTTAVSGNRPPIPNTPDEVRTHPGDPVAARWWRFWRSPEDQPRWARPILLAIAAFATALYSWNLSAAGYAPFYSSSVKSMSVSWKAWFFGAMDPGATITLDKIPGAFGIQALFARVFGFHEWSVTLPQVLEGVIAVLVLYRVVRRWAGPVAGLIAAGLFTCTPVVASMFGHSMEDGALICCLVLAADRLQVAVTQGRLRSLIWAGFWVGVGFQMKMMQAWMVLPAFALAYLLTAPGNVRRRIGHTLTAGAVCVAVSVTWVVMMEIVPAKDRPYVDGSTNNSAVAMVFGYNGLERFGINIPGAVEDTLGGSSSGGGGGNGVGSGGPGAPQVGEAPGSPQFGGVGNAGSPGVVGGVGGGGSGGGVPGATSGVSGPRWQKLLGGRLADQISWMLPLALLSCVLGLRVRRCAERTDTQLAGFVFWGSWLVVVGLIFSEMNTIPHTAYMSMLAPPISALCGAGLVLLWRTYRQGARLAWMLPAAVAFQITWTWYLWSGYISFAPWLLWPATLIACVAVVALITARFVRRTRARLSAIAAAAALAVTCVGTVAWASTGFNVHDDGSAFDASAGPQGQGFSTNSSGDVGSQTASTTLTSDQSKLWSYVTAHQSGAEYPLAVIGWINAQGYILATGKNVLPIGGFSGLVPQPSLSEFTTLVHGGEVHFVLTGGTAGAVDTEGASITASSQITSWVEAHCTEIPSTDYGVAATSDSESQDAGPGSSTSVNSGVLYQCGTSA